MNTFIGDYVLITGGSIAIGNNCDIAPRCVIHAGSHELGLRNRRAGKIYAGTIEIGDGTWIGTNATILAGAKIGKGVIVAAGAVVIAGEYPDDILLAGTPAKIKKKLM
jgi:acetyltransferase-like isoleucine patch superfamily enzyme